MQNLENRRILVTGGVGFIGSHLCEALSKSGADVFAFDNFDSFYARALKDRNAEAVTAAGGAVLRGDIRDAATVRQTLRDNSIDTVVHLAARAGVRPSLENPPLYADVNVNGTTVMLESARDLGIRKFVFASSSSVYGAHSAERFLETDNTDFPLSPYGATKKAGELLCHTFHHLYGLSIACLRFFTVYGPRQRPDLAIRKFVELALAGKEIPVYGDGTTSRDYTHVTDILSGLLGAIRWVDSDAPRYDIFNLGSSKPVILNDLLRIIESAVATPLKLNHLPPQPGDVPRTFADSTKAERELSFRQTISIDDGVRDFVRWIKTQS